ncbi:MAG: DUF4129 domain-containing protein, partial [Candidatus Omnitrophica bacterium]|nr:DUF4129 domain-containing protein [Candidatus Omnitrophota bacterium]
LNDGKMINRTADAIYLAIVRFRSDFKNLESEKLLGWLMLLLVVLVFVRNYRNIGGFLHWCLSPNRKSFQRKKLTRKDYVRTYQELETILRRRFKTRQQHTETHTEFVQRLRRHHPDQSALIESIDAFLVLYQDNRFGEKDRPELPTKLREIKTVSS